MDGGGIHNGFISGTTWYWETDAYGLKADNLHRPSLVDHWFCLNIPVRCVVFKSSVGSDSHLAWDVEFHGKKQAHCLNNLLWVLWTVCVSIWCCEWAHTRVCFLVMVENFCWLSKMLIIFSLSLDTIVGGLVMVLCRQCRQNLTWFNIVRMHKTKYNVTKCQNISNLSTSNLPLFLFSLAFLFQADALSFSSSRTASLLGLFESLLGRRRHTLRLICFAWRKMSLCRLDVTSHSSQPTFFLSNALACDK